ncbi:MAG TPA: aspartate aminotransferase family protein [Candidatus Dormibacteraeota bacterium]|nr:aspartate aminotransferase family protein [Candidatus Dormibacteraeota bacterium]
MIATAPPAALEELVLTALEAVRAGRAERGGPLPAGGPASVDGGMRRVIGERLGEDRTAAGVALEELARAAAYGAADPSHPACAGHLHCPPLDVAVAADLVVSALNPSLDSWDQAPGGQTFEDTALDVIAGLAGWTRASGAFTTGGTESNLMGLLLAREHGGRGPRTRVLCSEAAHFSIDRGAWLLGLEADVVRLPVDERHRLRPDALAAALGRFGEGCAVVATAGTTDLGAVDPLPEIARLARAHGAWLHVDAAYGGGALLSRRLAPLLNGIELADSIALDLHKLGWQPVPAGVFLARGERALDCLERQVAYLNPADDVDAGLPSRIGRSLRTTRRLDAFKVAVTLRTWGTEGLGELVDRCHDLAIHAAERVEASPHLEPLTPPVLTSVVFRYRSRRRAADAVNAGLRRRLLRSGAAVVGRSEVKGAVWLKLTLLNPWAATTDLDAVLEAVVAAGEEEDR